MLRSGIELSCLSEVIKGISIVMEVATIIQSGSFKFVDFRISIVFFFISSEIFSILSSSRNDVIVLNSFWVICLND